LSMRHGSTFTFCLPGCFLYREGRSPVVSSWVKLGLRKSWLAALYLGVDGKSFSPTARDAGSEFGFGDGAVVGIVWAGLESPSPAPLACVSRSLQVDPGDGGAGVGSVSISGGGGLHSSQSGADRLGGWNEWQSWWATNGVACRGISGGKGRRGWCLTG
jgi:hypothetical protein